MSDNDAQGRIQEGEGGGGNRTMASKTITLLCDTASGLVGLVSSNRLAPQDSRLDPPLTMRTPLSLSPSCRSLSPETVATDL